MAILNTFGYIMAARPVDASTEVEFYSVPAGTQINGVLRVVNGDTVAREFSVYHCPAGWGEVAALQRHSLCYLGRVEPGEPREFSIHAGPLETIRVFVGTPTTSFHLSGQKKVVS
jgi:hypothetical protein